MVSPTARQEENPLTKQNISKYSHKEVEPIMGRLLIVDDEPMIRDLLAQALERRSFSVDVAEEAEVAWSRLQTTDYDCILLDLNVPRMGGKELYKLINTLDNLLGEKVIFMSGDTVSPDIRAFLGSTQNSVLSKPFDLNELYCRVSEVLT